MRLAGWGRRSQGQGARRRRVRSGSRIGAGRFVPAFCAALAVTLILREVSAAQCHTLSLRPPIVADQVLGASLAALGATLSSLSVGSLMAARLRDAGRSAWPAWLALSAAFLPSSLTRVADLGVAIDHPTAIATVAGPFLLACLGAVYARLDTAA